MSSWVVLYFQLTSPETHHGQLDSDDDVIIEKEASNDDVTIEKEAAYDFDDYFWIRKFKS